MRLEILSRLEVTHTFRCLNFSGFFRIQSKTPGNTANDRKQRTLEKVICEFLGERVVDCFEDATSSEQLSHLKGRRRSVKMCEFQWRSRTAGVRSRYQSSTGGRCTADAETVSARYIRTFVRATLGQQTCKEELRHQHDWFLDLKIAILYFFKVTETVFSIGL